MVLDDSWASATLMWLPCASCFLRTGTSFHIGFFLGEENVDVCKDTYAPIGAPTGFCRFSWDSLCCTLFVVNPNVPPPSLPPSLPLCMKPCAMFFCVSSFHGNISYWRLITEHQYHSSVSLVVVVAERLSVRLIIVQARRALVGP